MLVDPADLAYAEFRGHPSVKDSQWILLGVFALAFAAVDAWATYQSV